MKIGESFQFYNCRMEVFELSIVECSHLYKRYGSCEVIKDLSFRVDEGEILGLLGPNGAGKTTTIKIILGLTAADSGTIRIKEGANIGYSPETPYFHQFLTGREVLRFYSRLQKIGKPRAEAQIEQLLDAVGLGDSGDKKTGTYSKGMLQRLAAAQSMLGDPGLLILDEPTSGLDTIGRLEMIRLILELKQKGRSVIINSHILGDVEKVADRVVFIVKGRNAGSVERCEYMETGLERLFMKAAGKDAPGTEIAGGSEDTCAL